MPKCELCGKKGRDLSLLVANHKQLGQIEICQGCWSELFEKNRMVCGTSGSGGSCPTCR